VSNAQPAWQPLNLVMCPKIASGHLVELRKCQSRPEFLQYNCDKNRHLLVCERVRRLAIEGVHSIRTVPCNSSARQRCRSAYVPGVRFDQRLFESRDRKKGACAERQLDDVPHLFATVEHRYQLPTTEGASKDLLLDPRFLQGLAVRVERTTDGFRICGGVDANDVHNA